MNYIPYSVMVGYSGPSALTELDRCRCYALLETLYRLSLIEHEHFFIHEMWGG